MSHETPDEPRERADGRTKDQRETGVVINLTPELLERLEGNAYRYGIIARSVPCDGCGGWLRTFADGYVSRRFCRCEGEGKESKTL